MRLYPYLYGYRVWSSWGCAHPHCGGVHTPTRRIFQVYVWEILGIFFRREADFFRIRRVYVEFYVVLGVICAWAGGGVRRLVGVCTPPQLRLSWWGCTSSRGGVRLLAGVCTPPQLRLSWWGCTSSRGGVHTPTVTFELVRVYVFS